MVYLVVGSKLALSYVFGMCDFVPLSLSPLAEKIRDDLLPCLSLQYNTQDAFL